MKDKTKLILLSVALISLCIAFFKVNSDIEKSKIPQFIPIEYQNENGITLVGTYDLSRESCRLVYETFNELNQKMPLKALRECLLIGVG